ncbi:MAG: LPS export ABC transporter permease LptG [Syntrophobacteria bacterium]
MKTLDRYIGVSFIQGFLLVIFILVSLFSFLEFVVQLDDIGKGNYQLLDAFAYIGLTIPRRVLDMVPMAALLGSIIALGMLADKGELIVMRASGLSVQRICFSVLATGALLMLATGIMEEYVAPPMEQYARLSRSLAISDTGILLTRDGFWARQGHSFIHVGKTLSGGIATDLDIYEGDKEGGLRAFIHAREADIHNNKRWVLKDIQKKVIEEQRITTHNLPTMALESFLNTEQVNILALPPDSLSPSDLYQYIQALRQRGQNADTYVLALWQKLAVPLTTGAMVLLALPFVFGPPRGTTIGLRITVGAMVGIGFYLANQIIGYMGLLLELHPAITTLAPVAAILWIALWRLRQAP